MTGNDFKWPEVTGSDRKWPEVTGSDWKWPKVTGSDRKWLEVTGSDRKRPEATGSDWKWPEVTESDQKWPEMTGTRFLGTNEIFWTDQKCETEHDNFYFWNKLSFLHWNVQTKMFKCSLHATFSRPKSQQKQLPDVSTHLGWKPDRYINVEQILYATKRSNFLEQCLQTNEAMAVI